MRFAPLLALAPLVLLVPALASADGGVTVEGSGSVTVGGPGAPPPAAAPPPPVVYNPNAPGAPAPVYNGPGAYPPPPPPPPPPGPPPGAYTHDGFYLRMALGAGALGVTAKTDPDSGSEVKYSGGGAGMDLAIGGTLDPGIVLGGEFVFQQAVKPDVSVNGNKIGSLTSNLNFGILGPFIDWFPNPETGFHFGGFLGSAVVTMSDQNGNTNSNSLNGWGGGVHVGYDFWVAQQWSLGVLGKFYGASLHDNNASNNSGNVKVTENASAFTLSFSVLYH